MTDHAALALPADGPPLTADEAAYIAGALAPNTIRSYSGHWREFVAWAAANGHTPLPAPPEAVSQYLVALAHAGATVGTMGVKLTAVKHAHKVAGHPDPTSTARVDYTWEGIRREHGSPADQAKPLMPPVLVDVIAACPDVCRPRKGQPPETSLLGLRDRAMLLTGFWGAMRRSEIAALTVANLSDHPDGITITLTHSKTNQHGAAEHMILPRARNPDLCPVTALRNWLDAAGIDDGPVFRGVRRENRVTSGKLATESMNKILRGALARAGVDPDGYSMHSLRAGFVTYAHMRGATDREIMAQTRHRSPETLGLYVRVQDAWKMNAATRLGL
jgi:integrase